MKMYQNAQSRRRIQEKHKQSPTKLWFQARALAWQGSRSTQEPTQRRRCGEAPTRVRPHPIVASWAHSLGGGAINAPKDGCMGAYQKYLTKPSYSSDKRRPILTFKDIHIWRRRRRRATHIPLASSQTRVGSQRGKSQRNSGVAVPSTSCTRQALYIGWTECRTCRPSTLVPLRSSYYLE